MDKSIVRMIVVVFVMTTIMAIGARYFESRIEKSEKYSRFTRPLFVTEVIAEEVGNN